MPIKKGLQNMRANYRELTEKPVVSQSREKAIQTLMHSRKMTRDEAIQTQALAIVRAQARKK